MHTLGDFNDDDEVPQLGYKYVQEEEVDNGDSKYSDD